MDGLILARVLHVIGMVLWIGGVGIVTVIILPAARACPEGVRLFELGERKFSWLARGTIIVVGLSGLYMTWSPISGRDSAIRAIGGCGRRWLRGRFSPAFFLLANPYSTENSQIEFTKNRRPISAASCGCTGSCSSPPC